MTKIVSTQTATTSWANFRYLTGVATAPATARPVSVPMLAEVQHEQELASRLGGPEATYELVDHIRSMKPVAGRTLLMSGGGGAFAAQFAEAHQYDIAVLHSDPLIVEALKARVLGGEAAVVNHLRNPNGHPRILREHVIRPGIEYRLAELPRTPFPDETFSLVVIEQGHFFGLEAAIAEAKRLLCENGVVVLLGYMPLYVVPRKKPAKDETIVKLINEVLDDGFESALLHFVLPDEQALLDAYRGLDFPFANCVAGSVFDDYRSRLFMRAAWNLFSLYQHMKTWPVVKRLEESGSISNVDWWNFSTALIQTWGSPGSRRVLNWPVALRTGAKKGDPYVRREPVGAADKV
ncbi:class I SAM-dependent methyltransferase [[Pseudomonas] carboxydohydrogena]|uniref:Class I SAM-dependent methyltransferase n=1 Tax=Afipia carboxydohydrogena TaxID=290 RepID=A0ABY8BN82_AFICR|nr:methyltransferase domain-containing protein [[Pseudomonas] carboxydohydrogena]WEF51430.1 class I SAM-dependent methyltransferase [[Pseudomonas] carboxydohydrogena]